MTINQVNIRADNVFNTVTVEIPDRVSKTEFLAWWRMRTTSFPIRNERGVVDSGKIVQVMEDGINVFGANFNIRDYETHQFPFKMNHVDQFSIEMSELKSLKNCPRSCKIGVFGSRLNPLLKLDSLVGCPETAQTLSVYTKSPMLNLESSLKGHVVSLSIHAPEFISFAGLTAEVDSLSIYGYEQKSFKGIHRELHGNVKSLSISVHSGNDKNFSCGVLPFAMLDPAIKISADIVGSSPMAFVDAIGVVDQGRTSGLNVHEIQELLIDSGFGKYARL